MKRFHIGIVRSAIILAVLIAAFAGTLSFGGGKAEHGEAPPPESATVTTVPYQATSSVEAQVEGVAAGVGPSVLNVTSHVVTLDSNNQPVPGRAVGSGFVYDDKKHVVTNYHVVEKATSVAVSLKNGVSHTAKVIGSDPSTDLAVLEIDASELPPPLKIGDSKRVRVGQFVVALGNPFGLTHTLTFGVISALGRIIQSPDGRFVGEALQTDAPINPGNSGGPLVTLTGEVVGVNSQIISPSGTNAGIGFAIPASLVQRVVPQLIAKGKAEHPWLGIAGIDLDKALITLLKKAGVDIPVGAGVLVVRVAPNSPASRAGIHGGSEVLRIGNLQLPIKGDIIVSIDGDSVNQFQALGAYLEANTSVGQTVQVTLLRNGKELTVSAKLAERPAQQR